MLPDIPCSVVPDLYVILTTVTGLNLYFTYYKIFLGLKIELTYQKSNEMTPVPSPLNLQLMQINYTYITIGNNMQHCFALLKKLEPDPP